MSVCLSVCHKSVSECSVETDERIELMFAQRLLSAFPMCWKEIRISSKMALPSWHFSSQTLNVANFLHSRHGTSNVASVVNLVRPTTVASLSHWASTAVWPPTPDQANRLGLRVRQKSAVTIHIHHRHCYYYSASLLLKSFYRPTEGVRLSQPRHGTVVKVCSPCPRLYIEAAIAISTTARGVIRTWVLTLQSDALTTRSITTWPRT